MDLLKRKCLAHEDNLADENESELLESFNPIEQAIWKTFPVPILSENGIALKMKRLIFQYRKCKKDKNRSCYKILFDIALCQVIF